MNNSLKIIVYTNFFVAFATLCLTWITGLIFSVPVFYSCLFSFFGTLFVYNFSRLLHIYFNVKKYNSRSKFIHQHKKKIEIITFISFCFGVYLAFNFSKTTFFYLLPVSVIAVLYSIPLYGYRLRDVPGLKLFLIGAIWTFVTVIIPVVESKMIMNNFFWSICLQRFLFLIAITIPFDIRDLLFDDFKIKTIPMVFGIKKAKIISLFALGFAEILLVVQYLTSDGYTFLEAASLFVTYEITALIIYFCDLNKNEKYYSILIEGSPIMMLFFYLFATII